MTQILMKPSPTRTLRAMKVGEEMEIPCRKVKTASVRSAACLLKKEGYVFECNDKDLYTSIRVRRLK
jgi:hypothetical protein